MKFCKRHMETLLIFGTLLAVIYTPYELSRRYINGAIAKHANQTIRYTEQAITESMKYDNQHAVFQKTRLSVLLLITETMNGYGGGTGFVVYGNKTNKKFIITNAHICNIMNSKLVGSTGLYIADDDFSQIASTKVLNNDILMDTGADLCVMQAPEGYPALSVANSSGYGDRVYVVGHPSLLPISSVTGFIGPSSTQKIYYSKYGDMKLPYQLHTMLTAAEVARGEYAPVSVQSTYISTPIAPGNSGSPVLNTKGEVVGVLFATTGNGLSGFMVPFNALKKLVDQL